MFRICGSGSHAFRFTVASSLALATSAFAFASTPTRDDIPVHKLACNLMPNVSSRGKPCVLIACGSFNPPTLTHLRMFEAARDELRKKGFDVQGGYLSPVHDGYGKPDLLPCAARLQLARAAVESSDWLMVDDWEITQQQYSRTVPVLKSVQCRLLKMLDLKQDDDMAPQVMLLCGEDLLQSFCKPGTWREQDIPTIFNEHGVVCVARPKSSGASLVLDKDGPLHKYSDRFFVVEDVVESPMSSTAVRRAVQEGRSIRYLVPDPVAEMVETLGWYKAR